MNRLEIIVYSGLLVKFFHLPKRSFHDILTNVQGCLTVQSLVKYECFINFCYPKINFCEHFVDKLWINSGRFINNLRVRIEPCQKKHPVTFGQKF